MTTVAPGQVQEGAAPLLGRVGAEDKGLQKRTAKLGLPDRPQVNLLPPEITTGRQVAVVKRRMVWVIVATLLVCLLAFAGAFFVRVDAEQRHQDALAEADNLTALKRQYSPVVLVIKQIELIRKSREFVLANEVDWASYVYAIAAVLPEGVTIDTISVAAIGPGAELVPGVDELTQDAIGVISFSATSPTLPDASAWIDTLEAIPGLADANLQSAELQDEDGNVTYQITATVQVTEAALAHRTFPDEAPTDEPEATEGEG